MSKPKRRSSPTIIGIVGPTGAGKTTLAEGLAKHYAFEMHREEPLENPYWLSFYAELQRGGQSEVALKSQLFFLLAAQQQAHQILRTKNANVVWDVPLYGHKMYADLLHDQKVMSEADYQLYLQVYELCLQIIPKPDVLVVATTNPETLNARIQQRGREAELATPAEYWSHQIAYWEQRLGQPSQIPLLKVDSGEIDWTNGRGVAEVHGLISKIVAFN